MSFWKSIPSVLFPFLCLISCLSVLYKTRLLLLPVAIRLCCWHHTVLVFRVALLIFGELQLVNYIDRKWIGDIEIAIIFGWCLNLVMCNYTKNISVTRWHCKRMVGQSCLCHGEFCQLTDEWIVHSFINFYSASSSPLLLRSAPDYSIDTVSELTRRSATGKWRTCPRSLHDS